MTEAEAKTKFCPHMKRSEVGHTNCLASLCMVWRWSNKRFGHDPACAGQAAADEYTRKYPLEGYCGLAGAPK